MNFLFINFFIFSLSPRPNTSSSIGSQASIDSGRSSIIKQPAKKRHTKLFTDSNGRVIDVAFKEVDAHQTCPECSGECGKTGVAKSCCWIIWIVTFLCIAGGLSGGLSYYFLSQKIPPGQSCTSSSRCVENSVCTNLVCTCSPTYYVSGSICRSRILVGQSCTSADQCVVNTYCNGTCQCLPAYYYDTSLGYCNLKGSYGSLCSQDSQCLTSGSQCFILTTGRCNCPSGTYYDSTNNACYTLKLVGQSCTDIVQCTSNAYCTSSVSGLCQCMTNYYSTTNSTCAARITIGNQCSSTSQCISNAQCITLSGSSTPTCQCNTNYYADTTTGTCQAILALYAACTSNAQCISNAECRTDYGMSYKQCLCISYYYPEGTPAACVPMKYINGACYSSIQCISFASCTGSPSTTCQCNSGFWFNSSSVAGGYGACLVLGIPGTNCYQASNCISNSQCTIPSGGTIPKCDCASNYYFSTTSSTCVSRQSAGTACTFDQQCFSNQCNLNSGVCY